MSAAAAIPQAPAAAMSEAAFALTFALLLIAPLALAGVALINTGLGRSRSAAQTMLGNLAVVAVAAVVFAFWGASLAGAPGAREVALHAAGKSWGVLGLGPLLLRGLGSAAPQRQLALLFEFLAVAMAVMIPWGSGADRWRLAAGCSAAAVIAGLVFPLAAHWIWGGGFLAALGGNFGLGAGVLDGGGAATVHALGGLAALALAWIAGPRRGKFPKEGLSTAMPGHNAIYVLFGCLLALVGWLAWNAAGAVIWLHEPLAELPGTVMNTWLSAAAALLMTFAITRVRFGKPDASLCANGWLAGLVTSTACAAVATPFEAIFAGAVAGTATPLLVELLELALSIDDPSGAIAVHGAAGLWGLVAAGFFAAPSGQLAAQLVSVAAQVGVLLPLIYLLFALLNRVVAFRVDPDGERIGMDLHELGGGAYPEFVIHRDESYR
ncbi:MAG: ammonium transporter [Terracidiphilus sp.]